jgi:LSD1 subclass zinc finger protein
MYSSPQVSDMKQVKCPNCGATLSYKPGTTSQACEYCHSTFEIASEAELVQAAHAEKDLLRQVGRHWWSNAPPVVLRLPWEPACSPGRALSAVPS